MQRVAIIGSGPTGIYTLKGLVEGRVPTAITVFEESPDPGKGTPYHPAMNDVVMLANIASIEIPRIVDTLHQWLGSLSDARLDELGLEREELGEREFYPRVVLGEFFESQFRSLVDMGRKAGHEIDVRGRTRVVDINLRADFITVASRGPQAERSEERFDHVVMATGHDWPEETETSPGFFISPRPAADIKRIGAVRVGILGTSLSGIDAAVTVAAAHGRFDEEDVFPVYRPRPDSGSLRITMMSRKGLLPEADFYCPIPYDPCRYCTREAVDGLVDEGSDGLLDRLFELFRKELLDADPTYATEIDLASATVEDIADRYFRRRYDSDPFVWAERNLEEAKRNKAGRITVKWRYALLRMHENLARAVPHLNVADLERFHRHFKTIFVDDYATVPHQSIERLLALHRAEVLDVWALGADYDVRREPIAGGATVAAGNDKRRFEAFIDATGRNSADAPDLPFPSLLKPGLVEEAKTEVSEETGATKATGGIEVDEHFRPIVDRNVCTNLYCISIPFLLHKLPFVQGITSARDMAEIAAAAIVSDVNERNGVRAEENAPEVGENNPLAEVLT